MKKLFIILGICLLSQVCHAKTNIISIDQINSNYIITYCSDGYVFKSIDNRGFVQVMYESVSGSQPVKCKNK